MIWWVRSLGRLFAVTVEFVSGTESNGGIPEGLGPSTFGTDEDQTLPAGFEDSWLQVKPTVNG